MRDQTSPEQTVLYRLSGDYNELHISTSLPLPLSTQPQSRRLTWRGCTDPAIGAAAGFGGVILHGLSTFGFGARAIVSAVGGGDPRSLTLFGVRFTAPVKPGDALETSIWEVGPAKAPGHEGETELAFVTKNLATGKVRCVLPDCDRENWWLTQDADFAGVLGRRHCVREEGGEEQVVVSSRSLTSATCILHLAMCVNSGSGFGRLPSHVNCCYGVVDHSRSLRRVLGSIPHSLGGRRVNPPNGIPSNYAYYCTTHL